MFHQNQDLIVLHDKILSEDPLVEPIIFSDSGILFCWEKKMEFKGNHILQLIPNRETIIPCIQRLNGQFWKPEWKINIKYLFENKITNEFLENIFLKIYTHFLSDLVGDFTWNFADEFFIETKEGNFVWKDPDYVRGDNSLSPFFKSYDRWLPPNMFGRSKGLHLIGTYCPDFKLQMEKK